MKKIALSIVFWMLTTSCFADTIPDTDQKQSFPLTKWMSKNPSDLVTIQNGAGLPIIILISVDKNSSSITVKNCGTVTKIEAGSSAVCTTNDASNPVTINSDNPNTPAVGDYQIKPQ